MALSTYFLMVLAFHTLVSAAPIQQEKNWPPYFDYLPSELYNTFPPDDDYAAAGVGEEENNLENNQNGRIVPPRKRIDPNYNSPIYYIRLPPQPYMFVPGLGYISQPAPAPSPVSQFLNLPLSFVSNGKPSNIYQWAGNFPQFPTPTYQPSRQPIKKPDSTMHKLPGQFSFNGRPDDILVLRDSYNSLYGDALQNFYP